MPYQFTWESDSTLWVKFDGEISFSNLNNATNDFYNDTRSERITAIFWDFSAMTSFNVDKDDASEMAYTDNVASRYLKPMKAAFIATNAKFCALTRHYIEEMQRLESPWTNRLFSSMERARAWIASSESNTLCVTQ